MYDELNAKKLCDGVSLDEMCGELGPGDGLRRLIVNFAKIPPLPQMT
jgi:hypothetical protein